MTEPAAEVRALCRGSLLTLDGECGGLPPPKSCFIRTALEAASVDEPGRPPVNDSQFRTRGPASASVSLAFLAAGNPEQTNPPRAVGAEPVGSMGLLDCLGKAVSMPSPRSVQTPSWYHPARRQNRIEPRSYGKWITLGPTIGRVATKWTASLCEMLDDTT